VISQIAEYAAGIVIMPAGIHVFGS